MTIRDQAQQYFNRIKRGEQIRMCGELYSDLRTREMCNANQTYVTAIWLGATARTASVRRESLEMAERIYDRILFEQCLIAATDCACGHHEDSHMLGNQAA